MFQWSQMVVNQPYSISMITLQMLSKLSKFVAFLNTNNYILFIFLIFFQRNMQNNTESSLSSRFYASIECDLIFIFKFNNFNTMKPEQQLQGHILKFIHNGRTFNPHIGINKQTYGVSEQSPEQFHQEHTLLAENGYIYSYQDAKQFEYPSQNSYFDVHTCGQKGKPDEVPHQLMANSLAFHRKKGRLSQFMDKNGWMSPVMPIMGFERTEDARTLSNMARKNRINSLKPRITYDNPAALKTKVNPEYFNTISVLMSQKLRIRKKRQDLMKGQLAATPRVIAEKQSQSDPIHLQNVEEKMAKTTKDFYSTANTFYNSREASLKQRELSSRRSYYISRQFDRQSSLLSSPNKSKRETSPQANSRTISPSKVSRAAQLNRIEEDDIIPIQDLKLEDWYRTSCHSKWDFKPKKVDSQEPMDEQSSAQIPL